MPQLIFLGTSAATPTKYRNVSSHALRLDDGKIILLDCGEATQHQILKTNEVRSSKIEVILITHLHGDHSFGLPGLLASMSLLGRSEKVICLGPFGISSYINNFLTLSVTYLTYPLEIIELEEGKMRKFDSLAGIEIKAFPLRHKVPCFGYIITEADKRGKLDSLKAKNLGATGKDLGILTSGKDVTLSSGIIIKASEVMGETRKGKKFVLLGDTSDSSSLMEDAKDCDVLVHETTYDASMEQKALEGGHSTTTMAGKFAKVLSAKKLFITHFSMRYQDNETNSLGINDLLNETAKECPETEVIAAEELKRYDL